MGAESTGPALRRPRRPGHGSHVAPLGQAAGFDEGYVQAGAVVDPGTGLVCGSWGRAGVPGRNR
jgi:hypothetical protein